MKNNWYEKEFGKNKIVLIEHLGYPIQFMDALQRGIATDLPKKMVRRYSVGVMGYKSSTTISLAIHTQKGKDKKSWALDYIKIPIEHIKKITELAPI